MSGAYAIVVDGTAALPPELAEELGILILPLHVSFGAETFTAGVDLSAAEFYERLRRPDATPTTSQPSLGECREAFEAAARDGSRGILVVTVATELSGTHSTATAAACQVGGRIEVIDSRSTAGSIALVATACARARRNDASFPDAVALARRLAGHVKLLAVIDTLEYLRRSGRASSLENVFGSLLSVKPIITVDDGRLQPIDRVRTRGKAMDRLKELIEADVPPGERLHVCVLHTNEAERAAQLSSWIRQRYDCVEHFVAEAGPVIGAHGGPGVVGCCWYPQRLLEA
ncbi:DegV family protein [soil metagenome]